MTQYMQNGLVSHPCIWGSGGISSGHKFEIFTNLSLLPRGPGLYIMASVQHFGIRKALYIGQAEDVWVRYNDPKHDKFDRAVALGLSEIHVLGPITNKAERIRLETYLRHSITPRPPLNEQDLSGLAAYGPVNPLTQYGQF